MAKSYYTVEGGILRPDLEYFLNVPDQFTLSSSPSENLVLFFNEQFLDEECVTEEDQKVSEVYLMAEVEAATRLIARHIKTQSKDA